MAANVTLDAGGQIGKKWTIVFTADGDTTVALPHGFNGPPDHVEITYTSPQAINPGCVTLGVVDNQNVNINKLPAAGSAGASVIVIAYIPNATM